MQKAWKINGPGYFGDISPGPRPAKNPECGKKVYENSHFLASDNG
jgi:hypothetical protein